MPLSSARANHVSLWLVEAGVNKTLSLGYSTFQATKQTIVTSTRLEAWTIANVLTGTKRR